MVIICYIPLQYALLQKGSLLSNVHVVIKVCHAFKIYYQNGGHKWDIYLYIYRIARFVFPTDLDFSVLFKRTVFNAEYKPRAMAEMIEYRVMFLWLSTALPLPLLSTLVSIYQYRQYIQKHKWIALPSQNTSSIWKKNLNYWEFHFFL